MYPFLFIRWKKERWRGWWSSPSCLGVWLTQYVSLCDEPITKHQPLWHGSATGGNFSVSRFDWSWWCDSKSPDFLGSEDHSKGSDPPSIWCVLGRKRKRLGRVCWWIASLSKTYLLPQNTAAKKCYCLLLVCFVGVCLVGRSHLALGGLLGNRRSEWCWPDLEACELLSRHIITCSWAIALAMMEDCPRKISANEQIFVVLISRVCKWWCSFSKGKHNNFTYSICQI